jgi:predicted dehydrogenase
MQKPVHAILIGAGQRGAEAYAPYAMAYPDELKFIAVAEPDRERRGRFAEQHNIPQEAQFTHWDACFKANLTADCVMVCTQDNQHTDPAIQAMQNGFHVLLEKPMATTLEDCLNLVKTSEITRRQLHICHVLRYTPHMNKMREIIRSGVLGEIIQVDHRENVGFWHMAHSYVRGNWRNESEASPMILAKCCHDLDILPWLFDDIPLRLTSSGSLTHFRSENAPSGAAKRCLDGCKVLDTCPYAAPRIYLDMIPFWQSYADTGAGIESKLVQTYLNHPELIRAFSHIFPALKQITEYERWPLTVLANSPTKENLLKALQEGPYGRCVYHCDNNVVDHQVVMMEFEKTPTVTLTMHGHSHIEFRETRIEGSQARLTSMLGNGGSWIQIDKHRSDESIHYNTSAEPTSGHGGGDFRLVKTFLSHLEKGDFESVFQETVEALRSHAMAFAADEARKNHQWKFQKDWTYESTVLSHPLEVNFRKSESQFG